MLISEISACAVFTSLRPRMRESLLKTQNSKTATIKVFLTCPTPIHPCGSLNTFSQCGRLSKTRSRYLPKPRRQSRKIPMVSCPFTLTRRQNKPQTLTQPKLITLQPPDPPYRRRPITLVASLETNLATDQNDASAKTQSNETHQV